jgi:hypothetical protein
MPGVNTWNGKWSGEGRYFARIFNFSRKKESKKKAAEILEARYFHYDFGDGWAARIEVREVTAQESRKIKKRSDGFLGYDWMVHSIYNYGEIYNREQIKDLNIRSI